MSTLSEIELAARLQSLPGWERTASDTPAIEKTFKTRNFLNGLAFVTRVAVLAERANHHPDVTLTYPRVRILLTTHDAGGVTEKDLALAAEIDSLPV
jgi:4a-hydroxytetrahydrobiopterin dehydratase